VLTPVAPLDVQFTRLSGLADGWLDGRGKALSEATLTAARGFLDLLAAHGLPVPHCYPTEDGYVRGEWSTRMRHEVSVECSATRVYYHDLDCSPGCDDDAEEIDVEYADALEVVNALRRVLVR